MNAGTAPPRSERLGISTDDERNDGDGNANPSCGGVEPSVDGSGKQTPPCLQKVTLDHAVAPLLPRPTAPFERTERKRAHTAAVYYSECVLQGITPKIADKAAEAADALHTKWWVRQTAGTTTEPPRAPQERNLGTENDRNKKLKIENGSASGDGCNEAGNRPDPIPTISEASLSSTLINAPLPISTTLAHFSEMLNKSSVEAAKVRMVDDLRSSGGSVETPTFLESLAILQQYYSRNGAPQTYDPDKLVGNWLTLSKPTYSELLGHNEKGEPLYSLGRMCFDMYKATNLVCSLQASFNNVQSIDPRNPGRPLRVPKRLMKDIQMGECRLHAYDIVVAVTIEPGQDRKGGKKCDGSDENSCYVVPKPIKSILTTQGYALPDPNIQNRLSIWFSGGTLEMKDDEDSEEWKKLFMESEAEDREIVCRDLACRFLLGAMVAEKLEEDGTMTFAFKRPIGGHGSVYCDILYMDETLRVMKGHHGSVYVCIRVPETHKHTQDE